MKINRGKWLHTLQWLGGILGLVLIMLWASGSMRQRLAGGRVAAETGQPLPAGGHLHEVAYAEVSEDVLLAGTVHSEQHINLSARIPAYVEEVRVNAGDRVPAGRLLMALDQRELVEEQAAAEAILQQAETAFERSRRLLETNATTPQAHESAESNYRAARAQAERVKVMLTYTRIKAPIDGIVSDRFVEAGDLAAVGQTLLTIFDPTRLRIEVPVPASLIDHFRVGTQCPVILDLVREPIAGTVTEIVSAFDPVTRTRTVKLRLDTTREDVLPGMYGQVQVSTGTTPAILLPVTALQQVGQLQSVLLHREGRLHRRLVRTGPRHQEQVRIISGLTPGDQVWVPPPPPAARERKPSDV